MVPLRLGGWKKAAKLESIYGMDKKRRQLVSSVWRLFLSLCLVTVHWTQLKLLHRTTETVLKVGMYKISLSNDNVPERQCPLVWETRRRKNEWMNDALLCSLLFSSLACKWERRLISWRQKKKERLQLKLNCTPPLTDRSTDEQFPSVWNSLGTFCLSYQWCQARPGIWRLSVASNFKALSV